MDDKKDELNTSNVTTSNNNTKNNNNNNLSSTIDVPSIPKQIPSSTSIQTNSTTTVHSPNNNKISSTSTPNTNSSTTDSSTLLENDSKIKTILNSDSALDILSNRLKQSLLTAEEFSKFIKKKAQIEDEHYNQLKKFANNIRTNMKNNSKNLKNDSLQFQMDKIIGFDENLYGVGSSYVTALNTMYDELTSLINTITRSRKIVKDEYRKKDKECIDSIQSAEKSKQRYMHLCDDLERLKTSDPSKKSFSLKNKSVEQQEDDLQKKVDMADQEYKSKVSTCKKLKDEILVIHRPNNSKKLKNLILEMDIALNVQLQKYATWNENLIMNSGVLLSPLQSNKPSMKSMASSIDNEKDLYKYLIENGSQQSNKSLTPIEYHIHPSLIKAKDIGKPFLNNTSNNNRTNSTSNIKAAVSSNQWSNNNSNNNSNNLNNNNNSTSSTKNLSTPYAGNLLPTKSSNQISSDPKNSSPNNNSTYPTTSPIKDPPQGYSSLDPGSSPSTPNLNGPKPFNNITTYKQPTFGVSIEEVIKFAGIDNVPLIVRRCIEIIENYGIDLVGIYRTSSNINQVTKLKDLIDSNFTNYLTIGANINPNNIIDNKIFAVASLLKLYFINLPEPLVTNLESKSFIETVKLNDEHLIAKKLHHLVFNLPDGSYFTLRSLIFHLNKISLNESKNRMNKKSLSIIWGPVIFNDNSSNAQDLSYKSKVVEELMTIANDIFEVDEE
ncbi:RGD1 [Candida pseudojiufengensis]|uniref:RGD1 n=1 Tax=Candida pseudojiufengensis TaxID=497109 RepID=UPI00222545AF|nr:RGD1 [Candida pseudojiufengensis]KAI5966363.1 RGD1 [Candida pseudojiufengensis]